MFLANMTSPDVDALSRDLLVIIPVASLEQHSLHLPVFTDTMILQEVVNRIEKRLSEDVLILPVMWLGYSQHHMKYPGTVSASSETHLAIMNDVLVCMIEHGFTQFLLINSHGGNEPNISVLRQRVMEGYEDVNLYTTTPYAGPANKKINEVLTLGATGSGHAGECETSMIMAIDPELVKTDALHRDGQRRMESIPGLRLYKRFDQNTAHGGREIRVLRRQRWASSSFKLPKIFWLRLYGRSMGMEGVSVRVGARHASPVLVRVQNKQIGDFQNKSPHNSVRALSFVSRLKWQVVVCGIRGWIWSGRVVRCRIV